MIYHSQSYIALLDGARSTPQTPTQKKKKKKKREQQPASNAPSSVAERSDVGGGDETPAAVGPLTMAERRARKAEARATKIEAARLKREMQARDARIAELDLQDDAKAFTVKVCGVTSVGVPFMYPIFVWTRFVCTACHWKHYGRQFHLYPVEPTSPVFRFEHPPRNTTSPRNVRPWTL